MCLTLEINYITEIGTLFYISCTLYIYDWSIRIWKLSIGLLIDKIQETFWEYIMADTTKKMEKNQTAAVPQTHQFTEVESKYIYIYIL